MKEITVKRPNQMVQILNLSNSVIELLRDPYVIKSVNGSDTGELINKLKGLQYYYENN